MELTEKMESPTYIIGDPLICNKFLNTHLFTWVPAILERFTPEGNYHWVDDRPSKKRETVEAPSWAKSQPNGQGNDKCIGKVHDSGKSTWMDVTCITPRCFFCSMPIVQTYYLRGLDTKFSFNHVHHLSIFMQNNASKIIFEGQGFSRVIWYPLLKKTEIQELQDDKPYKVFRQDPFGSLQFGKPSEMTIFTNVSLR